MTQQKSTALHILEDLLMELQEIEGEEAKWDFMESIESHMAEELPDDYDEWMMQDDDLKTFAIDLLKRNGLGENL